MQEGTHYIMGSDWCVWHPPPPYLVIYSLSPGDDRLGTEDIQLETCNYLAAVSNIVSQQFLVSTNLKHHRHSSSCWNVTIPGFSHTSLSMVTSPSWVVTSYHLAAKCPLDISIVRCSLTCGRPSTDQPSVAAHCSQPSSAHITHWRLQRQPNTDCCSVLSHDWLALTLCFALIGATRQHFSYCWQTCSDSWAPTLTSPGLAKFSTGIPHELGAAAFPEPERSNSLVWTEMCLMHVTDYCPQLVTRCATTDKTLRKNSGGDSILR